MPSIVLFSQLLPSLSWIIISSLFLTAGDISFRYYIENHWNMGFVVSFGIYMIGIFFLTMSFFGQNIAVATVIGILFNITTYLIFAYFLFGDMISIRESIGLLLGFAAIFLLEGLK